VWQIAALVAVKAPGGNARGVAGPGEGSKDVLCWKRLLCWPRNCRRDDVWT